MSQAAAHLAVKLSGLLAMSGGNRDRLQQAVLELERLGVHGVVLGEHLVRGRDMAHPGGISMGREGRSRTSLDALVLLSWLAALTRRLRLSTAVLIGSLHEPVLLARQAATLDVLSCGRFDLGVAGGWFRPEFAATGVSFADRFSRMEEGLRACRALWSSPVASFSGRWTHFDDVTCDPEPALPGATGPGLGRSPRA